MQTPNVSRLADGEFEADVTSVTLPYADVALLSALSALATGELPVKPRGIVASGAAAPYRPRMGGGG